MPKFKMYDCEWGRRSKDTRTMSHTESSLKLFLYFVFHAIFYCLAQRAKTAKLVFPAKNNIASSQRCIGQKNRK